MLFSNITILPSNFGFNKINNNQFTKFSNSYSHNITSDVFIKNKNNISFGSSIEENNIGKSRQEKLKKLNDDEYNTVINEISKIKSTQNDEFYFDTSYCENIPQKYLGVISYCGYEDCSYYLSKWLDGRLPDNQITDKKLPEKFINCLDYSLREIDKDFGKYDGYVYRRGRFTEEPLRYYSSSENIPQKSYLYSGNVNNLFKRPHNIIKTKNGHKLNSMLKKYAKTNLKELAQEEDEILLDRKSRFRLIPVEEYSKNTTELVENYFKKITENYSKTNNPDKLTKDELKEKIKINVWEEI